MMVTIRVLVLRFVSWSYDSRAGHVAYGEASHVCDASIRMVPWGDVECISSHRNGCLDTGLSIDGCARVNPQVGCHPSDSSVVGVAA